MTRIISRISRPIVLSVAALGLLALASFAAFGPARPARADQPAQVAFALKPNLVINSTSFVTMPSGTYMIFSVKNTGLANAGPFKTNVENSNGATVQQYASVGLGVG